MLYSALAERETGQYPLSVATSLALEGAFGIYPERPESPAPMNQYSELWINLRTLYRNLIGAVHRDSVGKLIATQVAETLLDEMSVIRSIVQEGTRNRCRVQFYLSEYSGLQAAYPKAIIRGDNTEKQKEYTAAQHLTLEHVLKSLDPKELEFFSLKVKNKNPSTGRTLMLTHYAIDLLAERDFHAGLDLLESHTGLVKPKALWYTKYYNGKQLQPLPFREDFLQILGDAETFSPMSISVKKELLGLAEKYHFTPTTTTAKIRHYVGQIPNQESRTRLQEVIG